MLPYGFLSPISRNLTLSWIKVTFPRSPNQNIKVKILFQHCLKLFSTLPGKSGQILFNKYLFLCHLCTKSCLLDNKSTKINMRNAILGQCTVLADRSNGTQQVLNEYLISEGIKSLTEVCEAVHICIVRAFKMATGIVIFLMVSYRM